MTTKDVGKLSFNLDTIIGQGSGGTFVFKGIYKDSASAGVSSKTINRTVAIKRIQKVQLNNGSNFQQEVEVMQKAGENPNILQLIWTETNADYLYIATEFCSGTLEDYVTDKYNGGPMFMTEKEILRQLTKGLAHLHNLGIVHRDIKPTNILIFVSDDGTELIKLADFNISKVLKSNKDFTNTNVTNPSGTRGWMAPEVYESERFDLKVDIYALGLMFAYTLSGGKHPFGDEDSFERIARIRKKEAMVMSQKDLKIPFSNDSVAFDLIKSMLAESTKRPIIAQVEKSSFFKIDVDRTQKMLTLRKNKAVTTHVSLALKMIDFETMLGNETLDVHGTSSSITDTRTVLHFLCEYFNHYNLVDLVQLLIQKGADVNAKDEFGRTPLHLLCYYYEKTNLIDIVKSLIRKGVDINAKTDHGMTPLHYLCFWHSNNNLVDLIRLLIQRDVEVDAMTENGSTPLLYLCENYKNENLLDILTLLTDKGADVKTKKTECGRTPLHLLCENYRNVNLINIVDLLMRKGAHINAKTTNGETPLHLLCRYYHEDNLMDIVKFVIQKGAGINSMSKHGMTPADILRRRGFRV